MVHIANFQILTIRNILYIILVKDQGLYIMYSATLYGTEHSSLTEMSWRCVPLIGKLRRKSADGLRIKKKRLH
jgi:hypothetical protein